MTIEVGGPDGSSFQFPDGTPEATIIEAMSKHYGGQAAPSAPAPAAPAEPKGVMDTIKDMALGAVPLVGPALRHANQQGYTPNDMVRGMATGVPVAGGLVKKLDAATNATLAPVIEPFLKEGPDSLKQPTWRERYDRALELQHQMDQQAAEKSPMLDTAMNVVGGVAGTAPLVMAAPAAFGAAPGVGVLANAAAGGASGAALGGADALARGEDVGKGAIIGGVTGAAAPVLAKGAGKVVDAFRGKPELAPSRVVDVAGEQVPLTRANTTRDFADSLQEQRALDTGVPVARQFDDLQREAMQRATQNMVTDAAPQVGIPATERVTGHDAATAVIGDLQKNQALKAAQAGGEDFALTMQDALTRRNIGKGVLPGQADSIDAADFLATRIREEAAAHKGRTAALYKAAGEVEGSFAPKEFDNFSQRMKASLGRGEDPIRIDSDRTPLAQRVLDDIEQNVTGKVFENDLRFKNATNKDGTVKEVTVKDVEAARKRITSALPDAKQKAINGDGSDQRALLRILDSFDKRVESLVESGKFSGNGADFLNKMREARASHSDYMAKYHPEFAAVNDDAAGKLMQKVVGRYERGVQITPGEMSAALYDLKSGQGGKAFKIADRLQRIFGSDSPELAAYKEGLLSKLVDTADGSAPAASKVAESIEAYLAGPTRLHAQRVFTQAERDALASLAAANRGIIKNPPKDYINKTLEALSGANGTLPQPSDLANLMMSYRGKDRVNLMTALKREMTPESWGLTKRAMMEDVLLLNKPDADHQAIASSIKRFLDHKDMAGLMFDQRTLDNMKLLMETHQRMLPVRGSANNSKTGAAIEHGGLKKTIDKVSNTLLGLVGLGVGGVPGMAAGFVAGKVLKGVANKAAERAAVDAFYGPQVRVRTSVDPAGLAIAGQGAIPALAGRR